MDSSLTPAVVLTGYGTVELFGRESDGSLQHWWRDDGTWRVENLGGRLLSAPAAAVLPDGTLTAFAVVDDGVRLDDGSALPRGSLRCWRRTPQGWQIESLGGVVVGSPVADRNVVYARGADASLQRWRHDGHAWIGPENLGGYLATDPAIITGHADMAGTRVFALGLDHVLVEWYGEGMTSLREHGGSFHGPDFGELNAPTAVAEFPGRADVILKLPDEWSPGGVGKLYKFAWEGEHGPWNDTLPGAVTLSPSAVSRGQDWIDVFARSDTGTLLHWAWESPELSDAALASPPYSWPEPDDLGMALDSAPAAVAYSSGAEDFGIEVFARGEDGAVLHWMNWDGWQEPLPRTPEVRLFPTPPDLLLVRPHDMVVLGIRWRGMEVRNSGNTASLVRTDPDARVVVSFPPQHVAENTFGPGYELDRETGHAEARLAGLSWLAFDVQGDTPIPLTEEGILTALAEGPLVLAEPGQADLAIRSVVEIPFRMRMAPGAEGNEAVRCTHATTPVEHPASGAVGLWVTRLSGRSGPHESERVFLRPVDPGLAASDDPPGLTPPLSRAGRTNVAQHGRLRPASASRLELTALGGTLVGEGDWPGFQWKHRTALGRDAEVEVQWKGILYPFGHRAVYQELTERRFDPAEGQAVAALRKVKRLVVTEPVRTTAEDPAVRRQFPFSQAEVVRTVVDLSVQGHTWYQHHLPANATGVLRRRIRQAQDQAIRVLAELAAPTTGETPQHLIEFFGPEGMLALGETILTDPSHELHAAVVAQWAPLKEAVDRLEQQAAAEAPYRIDVFFPEDGHGLELPVRLSGANGDIDTVVPMIFVADIRLAPDAEVPEPFSSLTDDEIADKLANLYASLGDIPLPGTRIDLVAHRDGAAPADVLEVHRLAVEAGRDHATGEVWPRISRFEVALPALRALTEQALTVPLVYNDAYLTQGDLTIPFDIARTGEEAAGLTVDFAKNAERAGGLVVPTFVADGISRERGLCNRAGLISLDPRRLFLDQATLFGFPLADLIDTAARFDAPTILADGPTTSLRFTARLKGTGPFVVAEAPSVSEVVLDVRLAVPGPSATSLDAQLPSPEAIDAKVSCLITNFGLSLPVIDLWFDEVSFEHRPGTDPEVRIRNVRAEFGSDLKFLAGLTDALAAFGLGSAAPLVDVGPSGVTGRFELALPSAPAGALVLRNIRFRAELVVPFQPTPDRPISVSLAFASRENPFSLSVLMFGGGGYAYLELGPAGIRRAELCLEFGALVAVDFVVASGEVHALGGVRAVVVGDDLRLSGYIRFGGVIQVLGLVSVSVELTVGLTYDSATRELLGRATLVLEIDLTLYATSVEIDSGVWRLAGGGPGPSGDNVRELDRADADEAAFERYRQHFTRRG
ncbi:hypothetical protein [Streptomyces sp. NEAU-NA10]|uniref:hypothetical protein n=1 Tax=Streptomyces sp. NEAU-NA10 TaxID=3416050 RepID=UPI003CC633C4